MAEWNFITDDTATFKDCPYGQIQHNFELNRRDESDDDFGEDVFGIRHITNMTPGASDGICGTSPWQNDWQRTENLWSRSEFTNMDLFDSDPDGGGEGSIGVSVGYGGASLNWSFSTDGDIDKYINGQNVRWDVDSFYSNEVLVTQELEPGSVGIMNDDPCSSSGERRLLTYLNTDGQFYDSIFNNWYYLY